MMPSKNYTKDLVTELKIWESGLPKNVVKTSWVDDALSIVVDASHNSAFLYQNTRFTVLKEGKLCINTNGQEGLISALTLSYEQTPTVTYNVHNSAQVHSLSFNWKLSEQEQKAYIQRKISTLNALPVQFHSHRFKSKTAHNPEDLRTALNKMTAYSKAEIEDAIKSGTLNPGTVKYSYPDGFIYEEKEKEGGLAKCGWFIGEKVYNLSSTIEMLSLAAEIKSPIYFYTKNTADFTAAFAKLPTENKDTLLTDIMKGVSKSTSTDDRAFIKAYFLYYADNAEKIKLIPLRLLEPLVNSDPEFKLIYIKACAGFTQESSIAATPYQPLVQLEKQFHDENCTADTFLAAFAKITFNAKDTFFVERYVPGIFAKTLKKHEIAPFLSALKTLYNTASPLSTVTQKTICAHILTFCHNNPTANLNDPAFREMLHGSLQNKSITAEDFLMIAERCTDEGILRAAAKSLNEDITLVQAEKLVGRANPFMDNTRSVPGAIEKRTASAAHCYFANALSEQGPISEYYPLFENAFNNLSKEQKNKIAHTIYTKIIADKGSPSDVVNLIVRYYINENEPKTAAQLLNQTQYTAKNNNGYMTSAVFNELVALKADKGLMGHYFSQLTPDEQQGIDINLLVENGYNIEEIITLFSTNKDLGDKKVADYIATNGSTAQIAHYADLLDKQKAFGAVSNHTFQTAINQTQLDTNLGALQTNSSQYQNSWGLNKSAESQELAEVILKFCEKHGSHLSTIRILELYHILKPYMTNDKSKHRTFYKQLETQYQALERDIENCSVSKLYDPYVMRDGNFQAAELIRKTARAYLAESKGLFRRASKESLELARDLLIETKASEVLYKYTSYMSPKKDTTLYANMSAIAGNVDKLRPKT